MAGFVRSVVFRIFYSSPEQPPKDHDLESPPSYQLSVRASLPASPLPPPPPHPSRPRRFPWRDLLFNGLALLVSGIMIATIVLVVRIFENKPAPTFQTDVVSSWYEAITLNSVLSWLSAIGKLTLMIPVAECIGQMKWVLFGAQKRKVSDLDLIDGASRDALGALGWIIRFRGGFLVHLGAAFVIASLGFDPAVQQLVSYELRTVVDPAQVSQVSANANYTPVRGFGRGLVLATPRAVLWGATSSVLGVGVTTDYSCPSGNCTFPVATSVGVCQTCTEITDQLERNCTTLSETNEFCHGTTCFTSGQLCTYTFNGTSVGGGDTFLNVSAVAERSVPIGNQVSIPAKRLSISALYIQPDEAQKNTQELPIAPGYVAPGRGHVARAYSCGISFCEQQFQAKVVQGVYTETHISSSSVSAFVLPIPKLSEIDDTIMNKPLAVSDTGLTNVSTLALFGLGNGFSLSLTGEAKVLTSTDPKQGEVSDFHRGMYENLLDSDFAVIMDSMTKAMSAAIRNDVVTGQEVKGEVYANMIYLRAHWGWIAFPATLWVVAVFLIIAVIAKTRKNRRGPVGWLGNSQVAGLFLGLDDHIRRDVDTRGVAYTGDAAAIRAFGEKLKLRIGTVAVIGEGTPMRFTKNAEN